MINTQVPGNCKIQESLKESCQTILPFKVLSEPILIFPIVFYMSVSDIIIFFSANTFKLSNLQAFNMAEMVVFGRWDKGTYVLLMFNFMLSYQY